MLALVLLVGHETLLASGLLLWSAAVARAVLVGAHVVVVLCQLPRVELVGLDLRHVGLGAGRARGLWWRDLALRDGVVLDGVRVAHAQEGVEGRVNAAAAGDEDGFDDGHLDGGEGFLEHRLVRLLLRRRSGRLRRRRLSLGGCRTRAGGSGGRGGCGSSRGCGGRRGGLSWSAAVAQDAGLLDVVVVVGHLERFDRSGRLGAWIRHMLLVL